ncbi:predicted aconitase subunit 2 [Pseudooceanicola antarcticus]|uniref:Predicted aconitase subunit 2 n=1 Tax=Pseudooceanicola antarcticus TaxID=1247613 RepID=A0A285IKV6_9RHOB|nr:predicted aconitase subunit 2 [Pseudooceanicola antarcticus]
MVSGRAEGEALVTTQTISGWGGINERDGSIIERRHELVGQSFAGKILVFPGAKGSSGWSAFFHMTRINGVAPAAMLFTRMTTKMALGAVVTRVPSMTDFDQDVFDTIRTGDIVSVDADAGEVVIKHRAEG